MENRVVFEARNLKKIFGPSIALKDVDFELRAGEIRGLIGENGSGKSTVMSIASGIQMASSGKMFFKGKPWQPKNSIDAQNHGISMICQEMNTIPHVSVAQNIFAGQEKLFSFCGIVSMKKMYSAANKLLIKFGINGIKAEDSIDLYSFENRKLIEIVRCVTEKTEILVVDETTTALSHEGREILYSLIKKLAHENNKSVVFISHDIEELLTYCDCLTVLRNGEIIGHLSKEDMQQQNSVSKIREMMVGRDIGNKYYREDKEESCSNEIALEYDNISFGPIKKFSLTIHKGEILGLGGLSGSGMHEVGKIGYGLLPLSEGKVLHNGNTITDCLSAIQSGIGYISKNRDKEALILDASISENIVLPYLSKLSKKGFINPLQEKKISKRQVEQFRIKCNDINQKVNTLSGGNKQKVSFAKWVALDSDVIIMDCPTRGVDVGVKQAMYSLIEQMKKEGKAILMISEELAELIGMSDRLIVMKDWKISQTFLRSQNPTQKDVIKYMI